jgi:YD repeat-containing protein
MGAYEYHASPKAAPFYAGLLDWLSRAWQGTTRFVAGLFEPKTVVMAAAPGGAELNLSLGKPLFAPKQSTSATAGSVTIQYQYDPLDRLTQANYDDGSYFHYGYDAVGNRLSQTTQNGTTGYTYDNANRLTSVGGQTYTWDNNGNLLSDGTSIYSYNHANRLVGLTQGTNSYSYHYNGQGDRVSQTANSVTTHYTLDNLNAGLTGVLQEGTNTYLYGTGRIAQYNGTTPAYFLTDAQGSVRQLADASGQ